MKALFFRALSPAVTLPEMEKFSHLYFAGGRKAKLSYHLPKREFFCMTVRGQKGIFQLYLLPYAFFLHQPAQKSRLRKRIFRRRILHLLLPKTPIYLMGSGLLRLLPKTKIQAFLITKFWNPEKN